MRAILASIASSAALAQTSELLWHQHLQVRHGIWGVELLDACWHRRFPFSPFVRSSVQYSVFTSAGIARHARCGCCTSSAAACLHETRNQLRNLDPLRPSSFAICAALGPLSLQPIG